MALNRHAFCAVRAAHMHAVIYRMSELQKMEQFCFQASICSRAAKCTGRVPIIREWGEAIYVWF